MAQNEGGVPQGRARRGLGIPNGVVALPGRAVTAESTVDHAQEPGRHPGVGVEYHHAVCQLGMVDQTLDQPSERWAFAPCGGIEALVHLRAMGSGDVARPIGAVVGHDVHGEQLGRVVLADDAVDGRTDRLFLIVGRYENPDAACRLAARAGSGCVGSPPQVSGRCEESEVPVHHRHWPGRDDRQKTQRGCDRMAAAAMGHCGHDAPEHPTARATLVERPRACTRRPSGRH